MLMNNTKEKNRLIRVVIVEDNHYIREGWSTILDSDKEICVLSSHESCDDAFADKEYLKADIILLDIGLPGMQGTE
jgi:DNA-binding NarL/FixJ family response regulator